MPIIIDGYNLLFACPAVFDQITPPWPGPHGGGKKNMETARYEMLALLAHYQRLAKEEITVVFDSHWRGSSSSSPRGATGQGLAAEAGPLRSGQARLKIIFARSADEEIACLVEKSKNPKRLTVITSDAELRRKLKSLGAKVSSTRPFLEQVDKALSREMRKVQKEPPEKFHGPKSFEVDYWLKVFASHPACPAKEDAQHPKGKDEEDDA